MKQPELGLAGGTTLGKRSRTVRYATAATLLFLGGAFACGDDPAPGEGGDGDGQNGEVDDLKLNFDALYSAYDGQHTFKLPVAVKGMTGATFTASEEGFVEIVATADGAMLTMLKAGTVDIIAKKDNHRGTAKLTITEATPADYERGAMRYNSGESATMLNDAGMPVTNDAGMPILNGDAACNNCHGSTAALLKVQHTPQQIGGYSDDELVEIFTKATKPEGVGYNPEVPEAFLPLWMANWKSSHTWTISEADEKGILVYLRSLQPTPQQPIDWASIGVPL